MGAVKNAAHEELERRRAVEDGEVESDSDRAFVALNASAKDGRPKIVRRGADYARAYWTGGDQGMWAYDFGPDSASKHQIDFEPTHYREIDA